MIYYTTCRCGTIVAVRTGTSVIRAQTTFPYSFAYANAKKRDIDRGASERARVRVCVHR